MDIPIEQFIPSGAGLVATIVGLIGMWFKFQNKVERLEEDNEDARSKLEAAFRRIDENREVCQEIYNEHQKDAIENREKINHEIAKLDAASLVTSEQLKNIVIMLLEIKEQIAEFRKSK